MQIIIAQSYRSHEISIKTVENFNKPIVNENKFNWRELLQ